MKKVLIGILIILSLAIPTAAMEITAPKVPGSGSDVMPHNTESFGEGLLELAQNAIVMFLPELKDAGRTCYAVVCVSMLVSVVSLLSVKLQGPVSIAGVLLITSMIWKDTNGMIVYASDTVYEICEYGKLLCPVLTTALAAQGGITTSAALYTGTTAFISLLCMLINRLIVPMVYLFLTFSIVHCTLDEETMKRIADTEKSLLSWLLKTVLVVFTTYLSITGVVSGTTDAAALKAAKVTFSSAVPVVGGILSDASESVLVGIGILKNAAGIYGILAVLAMLVGPFVKVGAQYMMLKVTAAICSILGNKKITVLVESFSTSMGMLLGMVASGGMLILISTVCFLRGVN